MARHLRRNVVAYIALFFSLSGVGYAAVKIPRNSVGNTQLRRNAVTSSKVKNGTLTAADFAKNVVKAGPAGPQGPAGPTGATGPTGAAGPGAKLLQADPAATSSTSSVVLGAAGAFTVHYLCEAVSGGDVVAVPYVSGPAAHADLTEIEDQGASPVSPFVAGVDLSASTADAPLQLGPSVTTSASHPTQGLWISIRLTSGGTAVDVQLWGSAQRAAGGHPAACHFSASATPVRP